MQRQWYDVALFIYIALAAGLEFVVVQKTSRPAWAVAVKALAIFTIFAYAYLTVLHPALMMTLAGTVCRVFLAVAITWEVCELVVIGWTVLTSESYPEAERRRAGNHMLLGLGGLVVIVSGLVLFSQQHP